MVTFHISYELGNGQNDSWYHGIGNRMGCSPERGQGQAQAGAALGPILRLKRAPEVPSKVSDDS
ncbi:hypothetical protein [Archangium lansingense]|uniref:Uncharacterized protein n=1 Tax=Archangium lansingense TaxID=2995310 RepID=A0ABT4A2H4_9BACT|nr:hypothetical protein [Archangium lansinium]MCY1075806.1 hypothetical protein [Archangium lansinium]